PLTDNARRRLLTKIKLGQLVSAENKHRKTEQVIENYRREAAIEFENIKLDKPLKKITCSLLYWCEGAKDTYSGIRFTNSDPRLIRTFLALFRKAFAVDETKLRVGLHLHEYHNPRRQIAFWSKTTGIPKQKFINPFLKPHTSKRIKRNYPGCATIYYHSNDMARELLATAEMFIQNVGA
ncbi:MAG: hypothetical protein AAB740_04065, partial [Patescibacteria group bacterium]